MTGKLLPAAVLAGLFVSANSAALEFRSVGEPAAILYDAPSTKAQKLFVLSHGYPVEVVVKLEGWTKVRDDTGEFAWIENKGLSERRTVMVKGASAEARQAANENSPVAFTAEKNVFLELVGMAAGWAKVRHNDGAIGFVKVSQLWGL
ncbi:MAG TPA: SH3 domain-containing protein [Burkholderiales bacterium]|nr:SH3 domain-containing protein [Burkholderiales bacterium]